MISGVISYIDVDGMGRMSHKGFSTVWTGEVRLVGEDQPVEVTLDGTRDGPHSLEVDAILAAVASWTTLKADATAGLEEVLAESDAEAQDVWDAFKVMRIEVTDESWDPDALHVLIHLEHVDYPDFWPAIDVCGGAVVDVLSGT